MRICVRLDKRLSEELRRMSGKLGADRNELVERRMRSTLIKVVQGNPVETGRSRAGWVQSLEQLGGMAPSGWQGNSEEAMSRGRRESRLSRSESADTSEIQAANGAEYVPFLEYGTSRQAPRAMVRRALAGRDRDAG